MRDFTRLRQSPVFSAIDEEVTKLFAYLSTRKAYQPGDTIFSQGAEATAAYFLISGQARVVMDHQDERVDLYTLSGCTLFGELALLAHFKWFFGVVALTRCETLVISRKSFNKVLEKYPAIQGKIVEKIIQQRMARWAEQTTFLLDHCSNCKKMKDLSIIG